MSRSLQLTLTLSLFLLVAVVAWSVARSVRSSLAAARVRSAAAARRLDTIAESSVPIVVALTVLAGLAALLPQAALPPGLQRAWLVGTTIGLATGIPYAADRRSLRRRLRSLPPARDPLAASLPAGHRHWAVVEALARRDGLAAVAILGDPGTIEPPDPDAHRLRALAAALLGDERIARAYALRCAQLDRSRWDGLVDTGLVLCRAGHRREGCRLLQRAVDVSDGDLRAELALAQGLAMAGRRRDAVAAFDRATRRSRTPGMPA